MNKTVSQILQEARRRIEAGWCQGVMHSLDLDNAHHYCVIGAVCCPSLHGEKKEKEVVEQAFAALERALPLPFRARPAATRMGSYNDQPGRTKEEILALFDRALTEVTN